MREYFKVNVIDAELFKNSLEVDTWVCEKI